MNEFVLKYGKTNILAGIKTNKHGLVSLFNGISSIVGYLMPKIFSKKNSSGTI